ncbi:MAG: tRNA (adenosine(37)-N6)-threonylcarbamoyltransferase complex transferase subunit TsaD [bacterium]
MKLLSIETSCDDTCISIFEVKGGSISASFKVLANNSNSQIAVHIPYGGVYPVLAKREHAKNLPIILEASLKQAKLEKKKSPVDAIAVTYGPGLEMCLWEGISFAKALAEKWNVPLIPTNHMEGHVLSVFGKHKGTFKIPKLKAPILSLLVSGGHTQLVLTKKPASTRTSLGGWMDYEIIGETLDDAVGEAFDKAARMIDLPYPGGPQISKLASQLRETRERSIAQADEPSIANFQQKIMRAESTSFPEISLPRPMLYSKDFNFSFSGLKTAVLYLVRDLKKKDPNILENIEVKKAIALEFENAAIECLVHKTKKAVEKYGVKTLIVAGGVAANKHLRSEMKRVLGKKIKLLVPTQELSGDNSLMIGIAGYLNFMKNKKKVPKIGTIKATGNLRL